MTVQGRIRRPLPAPAAAICCCLLLLLPALTAVVVAQSPSTCGFCPGGTPPLNPSALLDEANDNSTTCGDAHNLLLTGVSPGRNARRPRSMPYWNWKTDIPLTADTVPWQVPTMGRFRRARSVPPVICRRCRPIRPSRCPTARPRRAAKSTTGPNSSGSSATNAWSCNPSPRTAVVSPPPAPSAPTARPSPTPPSGPSRPRCNAATSCGTPKRSILWGTIAGPSKPSSWGSAAAITSRRTPRAVTCVPTGVPFPTPPSSCFPVMS